MRVGVAGAGLIVPTFLRAAALVKGMEVKALFARKEDVREDICGKFHIPVGYDSYEKLLADPDLDVIYVALPNNLHASFAREALEAGKHVILEKPFISLRPLPICTIPIFSKSRSYCQGLGR